MSKKDWIIATILILLAAQILPKILPEETSQFVHILYGLSIGALINVVLYEFKKKKKDDDED